jgi:hypothetical protein
LGLLRLDAGKKSRTSISRALASFSNIATVGLMGNKVFGKGQIVGRQATDFTVQGTLDGNRLSWGTVVLTVDGNRMIGRGRNQSSISLTKEK